MTSYSQYQEDLTIVQAVEAVAIRRLLDLGAWNPTQFSNSRALIEAGWSAVLVECSPGALRDLSREYGTSQWPEVEVIGAAVGFEPGLLKIHVTDDAVSTSDAGTLEKWKTAGGYYGKLFVPVITLEQIALWFGAGFEFVNIDVEGASVDVFNHMIDLGWRPRCVCVEYDDRLPELLTIASRAGYIAALTNGTNVVLEKK